MEPDADYPAGAVVRGYRPQGRCLFQGFVVGRPADPELLRWMSRRLAHVYGQCIHQSRSNINELAPHVTMM